MAGRRKPKEEVLEVQEQTSAELLAEVFDGQPEEGAINITEIIRHVQIFDEEICSETVQKLINELNNYLLVDLWLSTPGGSLSAMHALIHYLNSRANEITIYLHDEVCSAGTFLLTDFVGELILTEDLDFIMFHLADRMAYTRRKGGLNMAELGRQLDKTNEKQMNKFRELGLTEAELKKYVKGKDVFIYRKDFHRLNYGQK